MLGLLAGVIAVVLGAGVLVASDRRDAADRDVPALADTDADVAERDAGPGPDPGDRVADVVRTRRAALAGATGTVTATVSFTRYVRADDATRAVPGPVVAFHVALPGQAPERVTANPAVWAGRTRIRLVGERTELQRLLDSGTVNDPDFVRAYRSDVAGIDAAVAAIDDGRWVFAVTVRRSVAALRAAARHPAVRMADPGAERGIRPEEVRIVGEPEFRPANEAV